MKSAAPLLERPEQLRSVDDLVNHGVSALRRPTAPASQRTFIVLGVARGGTTMVARIMSELGICMGTQLSAVQEDVQVCLPMETNDLAGLRSIVSQRNASADLWGFKRPGALSYIERFEKEFRNPEYLVVFRDPLAIAQRNELSMNLDLLNGLQQAQAQTAALIDFVRRSSRPTLLISYEKSVSMPESICRAIAEFTGAGDSQRLLAAISAVDPGNVDYLEQSRSGRSVGRLDAIHADGVSGWAWSPGNTAPVTVEIRLNAHRLATVTASMPRAELKAKGSHRSGNCGFYYRFPSSLKLRPGDLISAKVINDFKQLRNSPQAWGNPRKAAT